MSFETIYDESYERTVANTVNGVTFFDAFYHAFLDSSDEVREKFRNTDMEKQKGMLKKSFYHLLVFYGSNQADDYIQKIAASHNKNHLNIRPELYDLWLDTLMQTIQQFDPQYSEEVELAWRLVLAPGITYMKFKHAHCDTLSNTP